MTARSVNLPDKRIWLRVAKPEWAQPLDPSYAETFGGRWNPPNSYPTLYLSADVLTARLQIERMCLGTAVTPDDLADEAYFLVAATLPIEQIGGDAVTTEGLSSLGLPPSYPLDSNGELISHNITQPIGAKLRDSNNDGVWCRSACSSDGRGRELAWFARSTPATAVWDTPLPFGRWRHARTWQDVELVPQPDPVSR